MSIAPLLPRLLAAAATSLALFVASCADELAVTAAEIVPKHDTRQGETSAGSLTATAAMSAVRMAHSASTLRDGRVLIVGGFTTEESAAQGAEIYAPDTERFSPLPRLNTLRHSHTASVLPSGKVLIVGGFAAGTSPTVAAELFDPATNSFSPTGSLLSARAGHIAVLLENGKVLIAGGVGPEWTFLDSAELYDPDTAKFTPTSPMTVARESHAALRLEDGRILIAGGHRGRRAEIKLYASAETYDATTGSFSRVGDMGMRRHKHDAVLLGDGRVLITGGSDERDSEGAYDSTELFDPKSDTFTAGPAMARPRYKHNGSSVLLANGLVLIAGGAAQIETYDPRANSFALVAGDGRTTGQFSAVAPLSAGRVLITGGYGKGQGPQASAWLYRP